MNKIHKDKPYWKYTKKEIKHLKEKHNLAPCVYCGVLIPSCLVSCESCGYLEDKGLEKVD